MLVLYYIHIEKRKVVIKMKFTKEDYKQLEKFLDENKQLIEEKFPQFHSYKEWYKLLYKNACENAISDSTVRYVSDVFYLSNIYIRKVGDKEQKKRIIYTNENYKDSHILSAIRKYLKDNGLDFYNQ